MKKIIALMSIGIVICFTANTVFAQNNKKPLSPPDSTENALVKINYSKPSIRERKIFGIGSGYLQPFGKIWRIGANAATKLAVKQDILFGGKPLTKGTYALYAIPGEKNWTIIVNGNPNQWGTQYEKNKDKDILHITVKAKQLKQTKETLEIEADKKEIEIKWEKTEIEIPIKKK